MKNFKFLSSLAVAGLLTTSMIGSAFAADTDTKSLGEFKKLIEGETVLPYVLSDTNDILTLREIKLSRSFGTISLYNESSDNLTDDRIAQTGDKLTTAQKDYRIVVYGDTDMNGKINSDDAREALKMVADSEKGNKSQRVAANVNWKDSLNTDDARDILKFVAGTLEGELVKPELEEEKDETNYELTVNTPYLNNQYITSSSPKDFAVTIEIKSELSEKVTGAKLVAYKNENEKINSWATQESTTFDIPSNLKGKLEAKAYTLTAGSWTSVNDGTIIIKLEDSEGKELARTTVEKHTNEIKNIKVVDVVPNRESTEVGKLSLKISGDDTIKTMYYTYGVKDSTTSWLSPTIDDTTKSVNLTDNKLSDETVASDLTTEKVYNLFYILEDKYGSRTEVSTSAVLIPSDKRAIEEPITNITVPDLSKATALTSASFSWERKVEDIAQDLKDKTFIVTLYRDGVAIAEKEVSVSTSKKLESITCNNFMEGDVVAMTKAGTYQISVRVKGNAEGTTQTSKELMSDSVVVEKLLAPTSVKFVSDIDDDKTNYTRLAIEDSNQEADIANYQLSLVKLDDSGNESNVANVQSKLVSLASSKKIKLNSTTSNESLSTTSTSATLNLKDNVIYKVKISVVAKSNQVSKVNSDETVSEGYFTIKVGAITVNSKTDNSVTLEVNPAIKLAGKTTQYTVEAFTKNKDAGPTVAEYSEDGNKQIEVVNNVNENKTHITIKGLNNENIYAFRVTANVGGIEGIANAGITTDTNLKDIELLKSMPSLENLKVVKTATEKGENKIVYADNKLYIGNDIEIADGDIAKYPTAISEIKEIVQKLENGDIIQSYDGETLKLKLSEIGENDVLTRAFANTLKDKKLEITGTSFERAISATSIGDVTLKGDGAIINIYKNSSRTSC